MEYLIGLIALLGGGLFFYRTKAKSAEALNENVETKNELNKHTQVIAESQGRLDAEEAKREDIKKDMDEANKGNTNEELASFFDAITKRKP